MDPATEGRKHKSIIALMVEPTEAGQGLDDKARLGLLDSVGSAIWVYDGTTIIYVNRAIEEMTMYSREELLSPRFFEELIHEEDRGSIVERGRARIRGEPVPDNYEIRVYRKDGEVRSLSLHARRAQLDGEWVSVVSAVDVTELRAAQTTIQEGAAQVIEFLNSVPASIIATDPAGKPTFVNRQWLELTGLSREEALEAGTAKLIHPDDAREAAAAWQKAKADVEGYDIEYRVRDARREYRWQSFRIRPLKTKDGTLVAWGSASIDIHEAKELREQLEETIQQLAEAMDSKDELIGMISHELRTPLTTLLLNASYLHKNPGLDADTSQEFTTELVNDSQRLNTVIENMLVLSRVGSGEVETEPARLNILAQETVTEFKRRVPGRQLELVYPQQSALVEVNPVYFKQVLGNLISNAHKYSPPGEPIRVVVALEPEAAVVKVIDRGPGIAQDELDSVFAPFFRSSTHYAIAGIGLGLTVCRRLVELQGGEITVTNTAGGGCAFSFTVPLLESPPDAGD